MPTARVRCTSACVAGWACAFVWSRCPHVFGTATIPFLLPVSSLSPPTPALQDPIINAQDSQISTVFGRELEKRERARANSVTSAIPPGRRPDRPSRHTQAETSAGDLSKPLLVDTDIP